jgi:hypothetical protein
MKLEKVALTILIVALALAIVVYAIYQSRIIHNHANIYYVGVEVYWDSECTQKCTAIDWGNLYPGDTNSKTLYIKNVENTPCTLTMTTSNWNPPEAANHITLTWNYNGETLNPNTVLPITFTLHVSPEISGIYSFEFDINITATST